MQFPFYQVPYLGNGMIIGLNAVIHVIFSHGFAIGVFAMLGFLEGYAARTLTWGEEFEQFSTSLLKITVVVVTAFSSITGAGIWFTIGPLAPESTGNMLRVFFWPWFIEWIVFVLEVVGLLVIYFTWDFWKGPRRKVRSWLLLLYALLGVASAVLITGILGFMLTPGAWIEQRDFWSAFINPTFLPQLVTRYGIALALGALFTQLIVFWKVRPGALQDQLTGILSFSLLVSLVVFIGGLAVYFARVPLRYREFTAFSLLTGNFSQHPEWLQWGNLIAFAWVLAAGGAGFLASKRLLRWMLIPSILLFCGFVVEFERAREFIRGPYTMPGFMYASGVQLSESALYREKGMLGQSPSVPASGNFRVDGATLYARNCAACHTVGGLNDIRDRLRGRDREGVFVLIRHVHEIAAFMPPFSGTENEARILGDFLFELTEGKIRMTSLSRLSAAPEGVP